MSGPLCSMPGQFFGVRVTFNEHALKETTIRLFPESRHRSKRIHKKLCKRFGGEFRKAPAIFKTPWGIVAHPSFREELRRALGR